MPDDADLRGYVMMDARGRTVGNVSSYWTDPATGRVHFAAVKTGLLRGALRLVPLRDARLDEARRVLHVPYERARILGAPTHPAERPLDRAEAEAALAHYRAAPPGTVLGAPPPAGEVVLHEEKAHVGKRVVEGGGVRLRKVVRRETIHVPVEVLREEIVVERVGPDEMPPRSEMGRIPEEPFREGSMFLPTWQEEPIIGKTTEVVGGVRASKVVDAHEENVRTEARREDVEVERFPGKGDRFTSDHLDER
jgi:sporulation protein YlmC with PRC-barrel domain